MLTMHCTAKTNAQGVGLGRVKLSKSSQQAASTREVHHVYITFLDARTMFSPLTMSQLNVSVVQWHVFMLVI